MANLKRRIPNELPPPATAPLPNDAPEWVALGSRRRALVDRVTAGEDVYLVEPTGSRTDTGGWFGQRRVWLAFTQASMVMTAAGSRPLCIQIPLTELSRTQYNVVTGDVVFAPAEPPLRQVSLTPVAAARVLAQIRRRERC